MTTDADARTDAADGAVGLSRENATSPAHEGALSELSLEDDLSGCADGPIRVTGTSAVGPDEVTVELAVDADSLTHLAAGERLDADAARELAALLDSYAAAVDE